MFQSSCLDACNFAMQDLSQAKAQKEVAGLLSGGKAASSSLRQLYLPDAAALSRSVAVVG